MLGGNVSPIIDNLFSLGTSGLRWTSVWAVNGTIQTSDKRLKKNIKNINYGISTIKKLNPVSYKWRNKKDNSLKLGFIAQEIREVVPEAVYEGKDENKLLGINYSSLTPVIVKAIQEQQTQIENLKKENENFKKQIQELKNLIKNK